jgi:hypothetical protein
VVEKIHALTDWIDHAAGGMETMSSRIANDSGLGTFDWRFYRGQKAVPPARQSGRREMRRIVLILGSLVLCCLAAGCDKCGDPVKFNVPSLPGACYDSSQQK